MTARVSPVGPAPTTATSTSSVRDRWCRSSAWRVRFHSSLPSSFFVVLPDGSETLRHRLNPTYRHQGQTQVTHLVQHAVQRGLVHDLSRKEGIAVPHVGDRESVEPLGPAPIEVSLNPDLVNGHPSSFHELVQYFLSGVAVIE